MILTLDTPTTSSGIYRAQKIAAEYRQYAQAQDTFISRVVNGMAVEDTIRDIRSVALAETDEDRPDEAVIARAEAILRKANQHDPIYLEASEIEGFEGDLLIHWATEQKRLTLVSPKQPDQNLRLYRRMANGWTEHVPNPSPADIVTAIKWVLQ
jgi:hypothetical protein